VPARKAQPRASKSPTNKSGKSSLEQLSSELRRTYHLDKGNRDELAKSIGVSAPEFRLVRIPENLRNGN